MKKFNTVQEIQLERANQRENKIIYTLLGVLLGEIDRLPTRDEPTADQIYSVVKKMYDNAKEMAPYKMEALAEAEYLKDYIKEQLTTEQLTNIIKELFATGFSNMGQFMQYLNSNYKGQFDGKMASSIVNKILKG
jgi:uncharacterized protein YqeY